MTKDKITSWDDAFRCMQSHCRQWVGKGDTMYDRGFCSVECATYWDRLLDMLQDPEFVSYLDE